jgi:hypothetical protein
MVFMQHGLAVGFWMTAASLVGIWLLVTGAMRNVMGVPMIVAVPVLVATTILCKSAAGIGFLLIGVVALFAIQFSRTAIPLYLLIAIAPAYMVLRTSGCRDRPGGRRSGDRDLRPRPRAVARLPPQRREPLHRHALKKPLFGYGRWNPKDPGGPPWMVYNPTPASGKPSSTACGS